VEGVALHYGKPEEAFLRTLTIQEAAQYLKQGHFPPGSMGPKVEAAVQFTRKRGKRAVITSIEKIEEAVRGKAGTEIVA
jgi:carbamate kinase